eukprot:scaffold123723_cov33-Phaeocystis_antarctica.AAC.1
MCTAIAYGCRPSTCEAGLGLATPTPSPNPNPSPTLWLQAEDVRVEAEQIIPIVYTIGRGRAGGGGADHADQEHAGHHVRYLVITPSTWIMRIKNTLVTMYAQLASPYP